MYDEFCEHFEVTLKIIHMLFTLFFIIKVPAWSNEHCIHNKYHNNRKHCVCAFGNDTDRIVFFKIPKTEDKMNRNYRDSLIR